MNKIITIIFLQLIIANGLNARSNTDKFGLNSTSKSIPKVCNNYFEENKGQYIDQNQSVRNDILFGGKSEGLDFHIQKSGISYQLNQKNLTTTTNNDIRKNRIRENNKENLTNNITNTFRVDIKWVNCNTSFSIEYGKALPGYVNYYNRENPVHNIKQYESVTLKNVWQGVDIKYFYRDGHLESDFIVKNPDDYKNISMEVNGAIIEDSIGILLMKTPLGTIYEGSLKVFQGKNILDANWVLSGKRVSLAIQNYNKNEAITIDPPIRLWGTYYGESGIEDFSSCATDASGNVYLYGTTNLSTSLATVGAHQTAITSGYDGILVKFNAMGVRQWATYYGGNGIDFTHGCATDANNNVYICGETNSTNFIATAGSFQPTISLDYDAFIVKFNSDGVRQWGTYHGHFDADAFYDITVDVNDNIFAVGTSRSSENFGTPGTHQPVKSGLNNYDGVLIKYNTSGGRVWGTYYGGSSNEFINACTTDASGNIIVTGQTLSSNSIASIGAHQTTKSSANDAFVAKFNPNGTRQWGTYYGGNFDDFGRGCSVDADDNIYVCGQTGSTNAISTPGSHQELPNATWEAFLVKFNSSGVRQWGTYLGGNGTDDAFACSVNSIGEVYLSGGSNSTSGISTPGSYQEANAGGFDGFIALFSTNGILQWATYYGGSSNEYIECSSIDNNDNLYISGYTSSTNNIASADGHQNSFAGGSRELFLVKMTINLPLPVSLLEFNALKSSSQVELKWTTTAEINLHSFEIEKSTDGVQWNTLSTIISRGDATVQTEYKEFDKTPSYGYNYYRLKLNDIDGNFSYSSIRSIYMDLIEQVKCYPNPANDILNITLPSSVNKSTISIFTETGNLVGYYSVLGTHISIPTAGMAKGKYIIKISNNEKTMSNLVIIQ